MRPSRKALIAPGLLIAALVLAGCSDAEPADEPTADQTTSEAPGGTVIDITITADSVDPNGERVEAALGEPITLNIDADAAGELHVHSTPEQELEFPAGKSTLTLTIDKPGVVEVEDHGLEKVIVQLQVS